jgi:hypothetical protein
MKTYSVKLEYTCPYIGSRNGGNKTFSSGISLLQARKELLELYNNKDFPYADNWGIAVRRSRRTCDGARETFNDGTRSFTWDSRRYFIELDSE